MSHLRVIELPTNVYDDKRVSSLAHGANMSPENDHKEADVTATTQQNSAQIYLLAGSAAGIMEHCMMYPVDSVKTRMQCLRPHVEYRGVRHAICEIMKTEGFFRPVRGITIVGLGAGPAHALYFSSYELSKKLLNNKLYGGEHVVHACSAAVATLFHDGTMNPVEVIKQRLQMFDSPYKGVYDCARHIYQTEGMLAFYRSFSTTLTMNLPFQCLHFVTYEFLRKTLNPSGEYNAKTHLIAGAAAGGIAAAVTSPFDVAKTLLNTQEQCVVMECNNTKNITGMVNALRTIYNMHGVLGFFRGMRARVIFQMPSTAVSWSVYEFFKYSLSLQITEEEQMELTL